ncbi:tapasin-related protein [Pelobates fuscus]|uniref:tapasin-related protein n=1 Tax=Pelobates fuscus TaxID=191477 RepID=UPI002FE46E81
MDPTRISSCLLSLMLILHSSELQGAFLAGQPHAVDVVLPCSHVLVEEGMGRGMGGLSFQRRDITLVLRNVTIIGDEEKDPITDYVPPEDVETTTFQATVNFPPLPFAKRLLHAECEGEELTCELSHLYTEFYVVHLRLPDLSLSILLRVEQQDRDLTEISEEEKIIVPVTVDLLLSSFPPSHLTSTSKDISLNCELWGSSEEIKVEWHLQSGGKGQMIVPEEGTRISIEPGTSQNSQEMSLNIKGVRVQDEGTYICTVNTKRHQMQQIIKLQVRDPPLVTLSLTGSPQPRLVCRTDRYYPLDVEISWLRGGEQFTHDSHVTSSHRMNIDGTFNLTSYLSVPIPPTGAPPDIYTCSVSHISISDPIEVYTSVPPKDLERSMGISGFLISSVIFVLGIIMWKKRWAHGSDHSDGRDRVRLTQTE